MAETEESARLGRAECGRDRQLLPSLSSSFPPSDSGSCRRGAGSHGCSCGPALLPPTSPTGSCEGESLGLSRWRLARVEVWGGSRWVRWAGTSSFLSVTFTEVQGGAFWLFPLWSVSGASSFLSVEEIWVLHMQSGAHLPYTPRPMSGTGQSAKELQVVSRLLLFPSHSEVRELQEHAWLIPPLCGFGPVLPKSGYEKLKRIALIWRIM